MKKMLVFWAGVLFLLTLAACGLATTSTVALTTQSLPTMTTSITLQELSKPSNFSVVNNVVNFDVVENATKYRIYITDEEDTPVRDFNVTVGFNLLVMLTPGTYRFVLKATAPGYQDSPLSDSIEAEIIDPDRTSLLEGESMNDFRYVRWIGRTYYNALESVKYFYFTASGFEISFYGTEIKVTLKASNHNVIGKQAYIVILLDGEEDPTQGTTIKLDKSQGEYTLATGLDEGFHSVKVLKRSEASDSNTGVVAVSTDGYFTNAPAPKAFKIQFIAASSSTGYGNLGSLAVAKSTDNSNGLLGYAYLSTYLLDAEINIFAASGWGVSRGYNTGGFVSTTQNIPAAYEKYAIDGSNMVYTGAGDWNDSDYVPDVIVVNLGTNDFNASGYSGMSAEDKLLLSNQFITDYTAFLQVLHNTHPDAIIIVAYGLMGETPTVGPFTLQVIANANSIFGKTVVYPFVMEAAGTAPNAFGSNYHPNVGTSKIVAMDLAELINSLTGREIVRTMIN